MKTKQWVFAGAGLVSVLSACGSPTASSDSSAATTTEVSAVSTTSSSVASTGAGCGATTVVGPTTDIWWSTKSFGKLAVTAQFDDAGILCGATSTWNPLAGLSVIICDDAMPKLNAEVSAAKSAKINGISGATATSQAYVKSLQAAIDMK
jgi:hypothetical protein